MNPKSEPKNDPNQGQQSPPQSPPPEAQEKIKISKMSVKALGCNAKVVGAKAEGDNTPVKLCIIMGVADAVKVWEDNRNGQIYSALVGDFQGINLQTGQTYTSAQLFLPPGIHDSVENQVLNPDDPERYNSVKFAFEILAVKAAHAVGYSYQAIEHIGARPNDPLAEMRKALETRMTLPAVKAPVMIAAPEDASKSAGQSKTKPLTTAAGAGAKGAKGGNGGQK